MSSVAAFVGVTLDVVLSMSGSAIGTAYSYRVAQDGDYKSMFPTVISGVLGIYGLIVAVVSAGRLDEEGYDGNRIMAAGIINGFACLASGCAIAGIVATHSKKMGTCNSKIKIMDEQKQPLVKDGYVPQDDCSVEAPKSTLTTTLTLSLIFAEALALYGLIVALIIVGK